MSGLSIIESIKLGLLAPEATWNGYLQVFKTDNHYYKPDWIGYSDGRVDLVINDHKVEYFPNRNTWTLDKEPMLLATIFEILDIKDRAEEAVFWTAIMKCRNYEKIDMDIEKYINYLLERMHYYITEREEPLGTKIFKEDERTWETKFKESILPILGECDYIHTESRGNNQIHLYKSPLYGEIEYITYTRKVSLNVSPKVLEYLKSHIKRYTFISL